MNNQNFKYIQNFKSFDNGFGRTMDVRKTKEFRIGDKVEVSQGVEHEGKQGVIIVPKDLHKAKEADMVKVEFVDGGSDYISVHSLFKI
jgi:uncharacterized protein YecE (DUF72 family)